MELIIKSFSELTAAEFHEIAMLRVSVFVVEQSCPYQEIDDHDPKALHLWLRDSEGIAAYARVLPGGELFPEVAIGRVIAVKRRRGLGTRIVSEAVSAARSRFGAELISVEAQVYARGLYEKLGFRQCSEEFLEDGIPHIKMQLK
ncbi:MAG: GNAT family N-acetyltransferase [Oscillospiraceae bacterium]|nr:GNAT family N-acetyltransferase [Oscillospiraceae bacterium]